MVEKLRNLKNTIDEQYYLMYVYYIKNKTLKDYYNDINIFSAFCLNKSGNLPLIQMHQLLAEISGRLWSLENIWRK